MKKLTIAIDALDKNISDVIKELIYGKAHLGPDMQ